MLREEDIPPIQMPQIPRYSNVDPGILSILGNAAQLTQSIIASPEIRERRDYNKQVRELGLQQATTERDKLQLMLEQAKIAAQTAAEQRQARQTALQGLPEDIRNVLAAGLDPKAIAAAQLLGNPNAIPALAGVDPEKTIWSPEELRSRVQRETDAKIAALNRSNRPAAPDPTLAAWRNAQIRKMEQDMKAQEREDWATRDIYGNVAPKTTDKDKKVEDGAIILRTFMREYRANLDEILNSNMSTTDKLQRLMQLGESLGPSAANGLSNLFEGGVASLPEIEGNKRTFGGGWGPLAQGYLLSGMDTAKYMDKMKTALNDLEKLTNSADDKMLARSRAAITRYWESAVLPELTVKDRQRFAQMRDAVLEEATKENKTPLEVLKSSSNIKHADLTKLKLFMTATGNL